MLKKLKRKLRFAIGRDYQAKLAAENKKWGDHLKVEASGAWNAWLDHPLILQHYQQRRLVDGLDWEKWVAHTLGGAVERSLELGCGAAHRSIKLFRSGNSRHIEGFDVSDDRVAEGEGLRQALNAPGSFQVADVNTIALPHETYDLIFSSHSFHHFLALEHVLAEVTQALRPGGLFVLEEYVGPTQFQWTDQQMELVRSLLSLAPEAWRTFRWGAVKHLEGRPTPEEVVAVSPFESIRSAEIFPLFQQFFDLVVVKRLGGTIQHLLYNGIMHNFHEDDEEAVKYLRGVYTVEDTLIDEGLLPSDFMLLVGKRKSS